MAKTVEITKYCFMKINTERIKLMFGAVVNFCIEAKNLYLCKNKADINKIVYREAHENIQVMEFKGGVYLAINGTPYIHESELKRPVCDVVKSAREVYIESNMKDGF